MWYFKLASLYHNDNLITDKLSRREAQFIEKLMSNPNKIMTAEEIAELNSVPDYVRNCLARIRRDYPQIPIKLIMNEGYMWYDDPKTFTTEQVTDYLNKILPHFIDKSELIKLVANCIELNTFIFNKEQIEKLITTK